MRLTGEEDRMKIYTWREQNAERLQLQGSNYTDQLIFTISITLALWCSKAITIYIPCLSIYTRVPYIYTGQSTENYCDHSIVTSSSSPSYCCYVLANTVATPAIRLPGHSDKIHSPPHLVRCLPWETAAL